jgi:hypothetical protein
VGRVPPEVQADFVRRERETQLALQESAAARRVSDAFREIVRPYEGIMRAQGAEPLAAVAGVLQSHAALTIGPMEQRAEQLVKLWRYSGVPPEMLDQALARNLQPGQGGQPTASPAIDPHTLAQQIEQRLERKFLAQHQQATQHQAESDIEAFAATSPEFLTDVQDTMADLLELAARRRKVLTHQQAYEIAIRDEFHHPDIAQILKQRDAQKAAENAQASTQRARAAASSVRSQPAVPSNGAQPSSLREHLEQAFSEASGR